MKNWYFILKILSNFLPSVFVSLLHTIFLSLPPGFYPVFHLTAVSYLLYVLQVDKETLFAQDKMI